MSTTLRVRVLHMAAPSPRLPRCAAARERGFGRSADDACSFRQPARLDLAGAVPHGGVPEWLKGTDCKSVG